MSRPPAHLHGLDTLRAAAILLVVASHYMVFVSQDATFGVVSRFGWAGVDLFFALSGYLIGVQVWSGADSPSFLGRFYARRALRTLPSYWAVLALYALWPWFRGEGEMPPVWRFLTFTQNIGLAPGTPFSHAWSLCVEEQFYLFFPLLALALPRRAVWPVLGAAVVAGVFLRAGLWTPGPDSGRRFMTDIYYATWCRLDELIVGVSLALLKVRHPEIWARLTRRGDLALGLAAASTALVMPFWLAEERGFWQGALGYPLLGLTFGLWIVAATGEGVLRDTRVPGALPIAAWSYCIYLVHKQVCILGAPALEGLGVDAASLAGFEILGAASVAAGWALHRAVESPFMALRARYLGSRAEVDPAEGAVRSG